MSTKATGRTHAQAAADLGLSEDRLRGLIARGVLETTKQGRATLVVLPDIFSLTTAVAIMGITDGYARARLRAGDLLRGVKLGERAWIIELQEIRRFNLTPKASAKGRPRLSPRE